MLGRQRSRRLRFSAWATLPVLAAAYYALIVSSIPPLPRLLALEIVMLIPMTLTVVWSFKARAVSEAAERTFWGALAGAIITLIACEILLVYWVVVINPAGPPIVSWPFHILHGVAAAFMLTAVGALTRFSVGSVATKARWILDGLAVMIIAAIALLQFYVRPIMEPAGATTGEILLGVAYPVFGIVMVLGILGNIVGFKIDRWRWWDRLFAVSFMIYAVGVILWPTLYPAAAETSRTYERHILDLVQLSGHWLLMAAAVYRITEVDEWRLRPLPPIALARRRWLSAVVPAMLLVGVPAIGLLALRASHGSDWYFVYVAAFTALTALTLGRSVLIALDNGVLFYRSVSDPLTGLHNHRYFHDRLAEEIERADRYGDKLSVVLLDLDDFAEVNSRVGHEEGERLLREVGTLLKSRCTPECVLARTGGDDFGIIVPEADVMEGTLTARRMVDQISIAAGAQPGALTASAGVATFPDHGADADELLRAARSAMFAAKTSITEAVVTYDPTTDRPRVAGSRQERMAQENQYWAARALSAALRAHDERAAIHAAEVAGIARSLCQQLALDDAATWRVEWAAHLHGAGLIADNLPWRAAGMTADEDSGARREASVAMLSSSALSDIVPVVRAMDERWDGCGYPHGLLGDEIPVESRILAVAHAYVVNSESVSGPSAVADAFGRVLECSGSDFDPEIVDALQAALGV
ncbi:MAG TPA: diguanylate cyclase [Coriobacteriia bacterium]|nr:diguanylate cyclase [Coriobacteriia bacterium]